MAKSHMTKLYWYEMELAKLRRNGYASDEAHKILMERLDTMDSIEWREPEVHVLTIELDNNNLTVQSEWRHSDE